VQRAAAGLSDRLPHEIAANDRPHVRRPQVVFANHSETRPTVKR